MEKKESFDLKKIDYDKVYEDISESDSDALPDQDNQIKRTMLGTISLKKEQIKGDYLPKLR